MAKRTGHEILKRVRRISAVNGWSVTVFSGFCTLVTLALGQFGGVAVGLLVTLGGIVELHGRKLLTHRDADGMKWLVRAQLIVLGTILVFVATRFASFDAEYAMGNLTGEMQQLLTEAGLDYQDILPLLRIAFYTTYGVIAVVTLIYQGGLALYYRNSTKAVAEAVRTLPE